VSGELVLYEPARPVLLPSAALWTAAVVALCAVWAGTIWAATHLHADAHLHDVALFGHLAALLAGFGAVLTLDAYALLWLLGRRTLTDLCALSHGVHGLIWFGLAGLVLTGALLSPDVDARLTQVKLGLVLLIALNGLNAAAVQRRLDRVGQDLVPARLLLRAGAAGMLSQLGWWSATVIGFLNAESG
jgi:hypothetical protein